VNTFKLDIHTLSILNSQCSSWSGMWEKKGLSKANSRFVRQAYCRNLAPVSKIFATMCVKSHNVSRQCMRQGGCVHQTSVNTEIWEWGCITSIYLFWHSLLHIQPEAWQVKFSLTGPLSVCLDPKDECLHYSTLSARYSKQLYDSHTSEKHIL